MVTWKKKDSQKDIDSDKRNDDARKSVQEAFSEYHTTPTSGQWG